MAKEPGGARHSGAKQFFAEGDAVMLFQHTVHLDLGKGELCCKGVQCGSTGQVGLKKCVDQFRIFSHARRENNVAALAGHIEQTEIANEQQGKQFCRASRRKGELPVRSQKMLWQRFSISTVTGYTLQQGTAFCRERSRAPSSGEKVMEKRSKAPCTGIAR